MSQANRDAFRDTLMKEIAVSLEADAKLLPSQRMYHYDASEIPTIADRLVQAASEGAIFITSSIKRTCKVLGIKPTLKDIKTYLGGTLERLEAS